MALGLYGPEGLQWAGGGNAAGVQVFVYLPGTTTKIPLYLDDQGEFSLANPVMSDQTGRIAFYAEQGSYDLVINSTRFAINISDNIGDPPPKLVQLADVEVVNPTDGQSVVWESATSRWKNKMVAGGGGGAVSSVFGRTGAVVAQSGDYTKAQVGLGSVDNTSDANKPVSTAAQAALDLKAALSHTHATGDITGLTAFVNALVSAGITALIDAAPGSLDTLNELAAALGDDPNFATTITAALAGKQNADADLTAIAALAPADGSLIQRIAGVWNSQTTAQVKASMNLVKADVGLSNVTDTAQVPLSLFDAAGDILIGTGDNTATKLPKGANGTFLGVSSGNVGYFTPSAAVTKDLVSSRFSCKAMTVRPHDLSPAATKFIALISGRLYKFKVAIGPGELISNIRMPVKDAAAGAGQLFFGVYQEDMSPLGNSGNVAAQFSGAVAQTWQNADITVPANTTGSFVWITALSTMATGPQLGFCNVDNFADFAWMLNPSGLPTALYEDGVSSLPATLTTVGNGYLDFIAGVG